MLSRYLFRYSTTWHSWWALLPFGHAICYRTGLWFTYFCVSFHRASERVRSCLIMVETDIHYYINMVEAIVCCSCMDSEVIMMTRVDSEWKRVWFSRLSLNSNILGCNCIKLRLLAAEQWILYMQTNHRKTCVPGNFASLDLHDDVFRFCHCTDIVSNNRLVNSQSLVFSSP